jgi:hypothetical protein
MHLKKNIDSGRLYEALLIWGTNVFTNRSSLPGLYNKR